MLGAVIVLAGALLWRDLTDNRSALRASGTTTTSPRPSTTPTTTPSASPSTTAPSGATSSSGPGPTTTPSSVVPLACPPGVESAICEAAAYVEQVRGRPFKTFPTVELKTDADFNQALLTDFDQARADLDAQGVTLQALGLLDPVTSLADTYRDALTLGVVGFYDPKTKRLVVRSGELNLYARQTLVHELTHAFDDQYFDLNREDFADGDVEYGYTAVVEGNARRVDQQWSDQLSAADQAQLQQQELGLLSPQDMLRYFSLPPIIQQIQLSPYTDGLAYVRSLVAKGGEAAVDAALVNRLRAARNLHPGPRGPPIPKWRCPPPKPGPRRPTMVAWARSWSSSGWVNRRPTVGAATAT